MSREKIECHFGRRGAEPANLALLKAGDRDRTDDSLIGNQILYQLSYTRTESEGFEPPEDFNPRRFSKPLP